MNFVLLEEKMKFIISAKLSVEADNSITALEKFGLKVYYYDGVFDTIVDDVSEETRVKMEIENKDVVRFNNPPRFTLRALGEVDNRADSNQIFDYLLKNVHTISCKVEYQR